MACGYGISDTQRRNCHRQSRPGGSAPAKAADPVRWLEALVESNPPAAGLRAMGLKLELPGRARLERNDANQLPLLAARLRALENPGGRPPAC